MNLNKKLAILFLCIAIIPIIILEGISISEISDDLITQKELALDSSLVSTISNIEHYLDTRQIQAKLFASTFLPLQVDPTKIKSPSTTNRIQSQIDNMLEETKSNSSGDIGETTQKSSIDVIFVTDLDGNILASTQKDLISKKLSKEFSEQIRKNKPYFGGFSKNGGLSTNYITFSSALSDSNNNSYGFILVQTSLLTLESESLGIYFEKNNEIFLVDNTFRQITHNSGLKYSTLIWNTESGFIERCFAGEPISEKYINKNGKEVLGLLKLLDAENMCIIGEIELEEILSPIYDLQFKLLSVFSILLVAILFFTVIFSRTISNPIKKLSLAMNEIRNGNFNVKLEIKSKTSNNELDQLTIGFQKLIQYVKSTQENLRNLVSEQTKKLQDSNQILTEKVKVIKRQQEDLSNFKEALDKSANVFITNTKGNIVYVNDDFCKVSKFSRDELLGQNPVIINSRYHDKKFFKQMREELNQSKTWKGDIKNKAKDGSYYWSKATISPLLDEVGRPKQFIAILTDITNQKILEEKLSDALKEVKESELKKEEFSSMMTHELTTPLVPIRGYCEMLQSTETFGPLTDDQLEYVKKIETNSSLLERLIGDLLDVQKLDMDRMSYVITEFSIDQFMSGIRENNSHIMKAKNIEFTLKYPKNWVLNSDQQRLRQVLDNLIRNSVDFVPSKEGKISVEIKIKENNIEFSVIDNGPGIPKEKQSNIFKKFYQIDTSATRKHGGTGLGLVICKGIVEGLNGNIFLKSEIGKGTSFFINIPAIAKKTLISEVA